MKNLFLCLLVAVSLPLGSSAFPFANKTEHSTLNPSDTAKTIKTINIKNYPLTTGMTDIRMFDLYNDTLFLINAQKGYLVKINLKTGVVATNSKLNLFLKKNLANNLIPEKLDVLNGNYYISILNKLYTINSQGKTLNVYDNKFNINDFKVIRDKIILTSHNSIIVVNGFNKVISILPVELFDAHYILSSSGLCYSPSFDDRISEFYLDNKFSIIKKTYASISNSKELKNTHLTYSDGNFMFAFPINNRKFIYVLNKGAGQNTIFKKINLDDPDCTPNKSTILNEEGDPNFKISSINGIYYVIVLIKGKIKILSFVI